MTDFQIMVVVAFAIAILGLIVLYVLTQRARAKKASLLQAAAEITRGEPVSGEVLETEPDQDAEIAKESNHEPIIAMKESTDIEETSDAEDDNAEDDDAEDDDTDDTADSEETSEEPADIKTEKKPKKADVYHISQNKDSESEHFKKWRVRKQGSQKTIKFFKTQKEAILFAEDLASKNGGKVVVHKKTGAIRKQG